MLAQEKGPLLPNLLLLILANILAFLHQFQPLFLGLFHRHGKGVDHLVFIGQLTFSQDQE